MRRKIKIPFLLLDDTNLVILECYDTEGSIVHILVDTGAEESICNDKLKPISGTSTEFNADFVSCIGITNKVVMKERYSIKVGKRTIRFSALNMPLTEVSNTVQDMIGTTWGIDIILGSSFFREHHAVIDYHHRRLIIYENLCSK